MEIVEALVSFVKNSKFTLGNHGYTLRRANGKGRTAALVESDRNAVLFAGFNEAEKSVTTGDAPPFDPRRFGPETHRAGDCRWKPSRCSLRPDGRSVHDARHHPADALGGGLDLAVADVRVAQRHLHLGVAE